MYLNYYLKELNYGNMPRFLKKYLNCPSLTRLIDIGYFCGMDYASKDIYKFREKITRFDHSLTVALLTYKLTNDKKKTLAGLFHDISTPCFSHVVDYMNKDYENQESTEEYTEKILKNDRYLQDCLKIDDLDIDDIINFKNYSIVDSERPKLCADRIDGIILTGMGWTKNVTMHDINSIINDLNIYKNEDNEEEIGFKSVDICNRCMEINDLIDRYCHSNEDNYMMELLANITKYSINKGYISYDDLYKFNENEIFLLLNSINDKKLISLINEFKTKQISEIDNVELPNVKKRKIRPIVGGKRIS